MTRVQKKAQNILEYLKQYWGFSFTAIHRLNWQDWSHYLFTFVMVRGHNLPVLNESCVRGRTLRTDRVARADWELWKSVFSLLVKKKYSEGSRRGCDDMYMYNHLTPAPHVEGHPVAWWLQHSSVITAVRGPGFRSRFGPRSLCDMVAVGVGGLRIPFLWKCKVPSRWSHFSAKTTKFPKDTNNVWGLKLGLPSKLFGWSQTRDTADVQVSSAT